MSGPTEHFDVVVVGGGPAGATAAYRLARSGLRVVVLDRARFPRDKPCGGGVTVRGARLLPFSIAPVVDEVVTGIDFRLRGEATARHRFPQPIVLMTRRTRLDAFLLGRAREAGAEVREGVRVRSLGTERGRPVAIAEGLRVRGDLLIGADGANGICAAALGVERSPLDALAYEGNADRKVFPARRFDRSMLFEVGVVPGGYGWIFPKGDHVNVGVGGWIGEGRRVRAYLADLCARHGLAVDALTGLRGYRIPVREPGAPLARDRVLLVGDAAGLADPLSGDGMYEAFASARSAAREAERICAGGVSSPERYPRLIEDELGRHMAVSWWSKLVLERWPRLGYRVAASRTGGRIFYRDTRGERATHLPLPARAARAATRAAQRRLRRSIDA